jgi:hypothetical protein
MKRGCQALLALSLAAPFASGATAGAERPFMAEDIERRYNGRFLFTTSGDGAYAIFQRVDEPSGLPGDREVVCMMHVCYIAIDLVPSSALESAHRDAGHTDALRQRFKAGRDAYESALRAPAGHKEGAEQIWRDQLSKIGPCVRDKRAC